MGIENKLFRIGKKKSQEAPRIPRQRVSEDPLRIDEMRQHRETIIPLLPPSKIQTETIGVLLDTQKRGRQEAIQRIRDFLLPYEATLHAQYQDRSDHPEEIIARGRRGKIQFTLGDPESTSLTYVSLSPQELTSLGTKKKKDVKTQIGCEWAVFCQAPTSSLPYFQDNLLTPSFSYATTNLIRKIPATFDWATAFKFGKDGYIEDIVYIDNDKDIVWSKKDILGNPSKNFLHYTFSTDDFSVKTLTASRIKTHQYRVTSDGDVIRNHTWNFYKTAGTIESEIKYIINKLPFTFH